MMLFKNSKKNESRRARDVTSRDLGSQKVVSYYTASRKQLNSFERNNIEISRFSGRRKEYLKIKKRWFWLMVLIILFGLAIYSSILSSSAHFVIKGPVYRNSSSYAELVNPLFRTSFGNHFKMFIASKSLESKISQIIPEAQSVSIKTELLSRNPVVVITTAEPMAVFGQANSSSIVISDRGKLLLYTDKAKIDIKDLPLISNNSGITGLEGQQFLSPDEAEAVSRLIYQFQGEKSSVIYSLPANPHEIVAKESGRGYEVRFLLSEDIVAQFGAMRATQRQLQKSGINPSKYMDVRLTEKVYYQ
jgi:hypothetical protein